MGQLLNDRQFTHFHNPVKPVQAKGRRLSPHLLAGVNEELGRMETDGHFRKLEKCGKDCFISPIVRSRKEDCLIKLALETRLLNDQIFLK